MAGKKLSFFKKPSFLFTIALVEYIPILALALVLHSIAGRPNGINASRKLVYHVLQYPQISTLVISILSSLITWAVSDGMDRALTLAAKKRLTQYRPIWEIQWWSSLKAGGFVFGRSGRPTRRTVEFVALAFALLRVFIFSGFTILLRPLPYRVEEMVTSGSELDVSGNSTGCVASWDNRQLGDSDSNCDGSWQSYNGFHYQICDSSNRLFESLEAAQASMLGHIMHSVSSPERQNFGTSFSQLDDTRVVGSTLGVIPMGPAGISAFSSLRLSDSSATFHLYASNDYSLNLQGISVNVSCQYTPPTKEFPWPPTLEGSSAGGPTNSSQYVIKLGCPDNSGNSTVMVGEQRMSAARTNGVIMAHSCRSQSTNTWTYYLGSAFSFNQTNTLTSNSTANLNSIEAYAGIGSMTCSLEPRLQNIKARFNPEFGAFDMTDVSRISNQPTELFGVLSSRTLQMFVEGKLQASGHLVASLVDSVAGTRYKLPIGAKDDRYPPLIASMIKGVFEYQATKLRLVSTISTIDTSRECFRSVDGTTPSLGFRWHRDNSSLLGLIPLGIVAVLLVILLFWAMQAEGKFEQFDPTNIVSLIAASSAGCLQFDQDAVRDPFDENVLTTKVKFGQLPNNRWGLIEEGRLTTSETQMGIDAVARIQQIPPGAPSSE